MAKANLNAKRRWARLRSSRNDSRRIHSTGKLGFAHTRWATHGGVTEANAHPHISGDRVAVIHNGIIENYEPLKAELGSKGLSASRPETDTEVIAHLVHDQLEAGSRSPRSGTPVSAAVHGAYALLVFDARDPDRIVVARIASPLRDRTLGSARTSSRAACPRSCP